MEVRQFQVREGHVASAAAVSKPIVFVVDDDIYIRESLEAILKTAGWQPETFSSAHEFLSRPHPSVPSCLVVDVTLPGLSGLELQAQLVGRADIPIIFMTGHVDVRMTVQAMKAGAVEFLTKPLEHERLLAAISDAIEQSRAAVRRDAATQGLHHRHASLTPRERDVMALVVSGLLNKQVGGELGITESTVKAHRGQVMRKMNADSLPDLVTMAARLGALSTRTADADVARKVTGSPRYSPPVPARNPIRGDSLRFSSSSSRLAIGDVHRRSRPPVVPVADSLTSGPAGRNSRPPTQAPGLAAFAPTASPPHRRRPAPLGVVLADLDAVAAGARPRATGDGHRLAPAWVPPVLDLEEPTPA